MQAHRVGFISFRFAGTDGVSLEAAKWASVLRNMGYECYFMAGKLDTAPERSFLEKKLHFKNQEIREIYRECFSEERRSPALSDKIHLLREYLKSRITDFIKKYDIGLLIPQNVLTIPLNIPLGLALTEIISETGMPVIAHHHDFFWERKRFLRNCIWDYLQMSYPPPMSNIRHVVINSAAQKQLALRTGIAATLIPNVMNFELGPPPIDDYAAHVRTDLGIADDELFILQPTRVVQRKGIEYAIEFVARLKRKAALVISHASGDEGYEYQKRVKDYAKIFNIRAIFVDSIITDSRGQTPDGRRIYALEDIYPHADLISYPSLVEGFGNAFLEAVWFRKPILVNNYSIYSTDIKPKGFRVIEINNFICDKTMDFAKKILDNPDMRHEMTETNYRLGLKYYSYRILQNQLKALFTSYWGYKPLEGLS